jgi:tryptophan 2-monooxygenase
MATLPDTTETNESLVREGDNKWRGGWPNPAGLNFNFFRLLELDNDAPIAEVHEQASQKKIAVIGGGIAGVTAARELVRCGFKNVHLFEATDRLGGRLYSRAVNDKNLSRTPTTYELGAMRIPFFPKPGSKNSLADYYVGRFGIAEKAFPNPGAPNVITAVYMNDGSGTDPDYNGVSRLIYEAKAEGEQQTGDKRKPPPYPVIPDDDLIKSVDGKWQDFKQRAKRIFEQEYQRQQPRLDVPAAQHARLSNWQLFWRKVERAYEEIDFRELVTKPGKIDPEAPWDFGGMGMTGAEAEVFATIGAGDGGWGPFYDVSALWVLRTLMFGYTDNLKLIIGKSGFAENSPAKELFDKIRIDRSKLPAEQAKLPELHDTFGKPFRHPLFLGVQCLAECMIFGELEFHKPGPKPGPSFFTMARDNLDKPAPPAQRNGVGLYMNTEISKIERKTGDPDKLRVEYCVYEEPFDTRNRDKQRVTYDKDEVGLYEDYDYVILTVPSWTIQKLIGIELKSGILPKKISKTLNSSHWIASRKVFLPLKKRFWEEPDNLIPQVWVSNNLLQGVYAYAAGRDDNGVLLISYTWEDDALKLMTRDKNKLIKDCIDEFDSMLNKFKIMDSQGKQVSAVDLIDDKKNEQGEYENAFVFEWLEQPTFRGCAKLYRAATYGDNYDVARYNQPYDNEPMPNKKQPNQRRRESGLLFAGSSYSLDDGWVEPAMRQAIDAVLHIAHEQYGTEFKSLFSWDCYTYYPAWGKLTEPEIRE